MSLAPAALPAPPQSTLMRKRYVPLYLEYLKARAANTATSKLLSPVPAPELGDMDRALPEHTILMFRRLAHAELQREKRREARAAADAAAVEAAAASARARADEDAARAARAASAAELGHLTRARAEILRMLHSAATAGVRLDDTAGFAVPAELSAISVFTHSAGAVAALQSDATATAARLLRKTDQLFNSLGLVAQKGAP